jgi:hypothetical protein
MVVFWFMLVVWSVGARDALMCCQMLCCATAVLLATMWQSCSTHCGACCRSQQTHMWRSGLWMLCHVLLSSADMLFCVCCTVVSSIAHAVTCCAVQDGLSRMMTEDPPHSAAEITNFIKQRKTEQVWAVCVCGGNCGGRRGRGVGGGGVEGGEGCRACECGVERGGCLSVTLGIKQRQAEQMFAG